MTPTAMPSAAEAERDRSECRAEARARGPSLWEPLRETLETQAIGIGIGAVVGGAGVMARRGRLEGSSNATTDLLIIATSAAVGFVLGSLVGLVRAGRTSQDIGESFRTAFADCMTARGYR